MTYKVVKLITFWLGTALFLGEFITFLPSLAKQAAAAVPSSSLSVTQQSKTHPSDSLDFGHNLLTAALLAAQKISEPQRKAEALAEIANIYCSLGQQQQAVEVLSQASAVSETIADLAARATVMLELANAYEAIGLTDRANALVESAAQAAISIEEPSETAEGSLQNIAFQLILADKKEQALQVAEKIEDPYQREIFKGFILNDAVRERISSGQYDEAIQIFLQTNPNLFDAWSNEFSADRTNDQIVSSKIEILLMLAAEHIVNHQEAQAAEVIAQVLQAIDTLASQETKLWKILGIAQLYIEIKQPEKAIELLESVLEQARLQATFTPKDPCKHDRYLSIQENVAEGLAQAGQPERALQIVQEIETSPDRASQKAYTLINISQVFAGLGQLQQADEVLNQALELAQLMSDEYDQSSLAVEVARIYLEINKEQANQLLEQTLQQYDNLESDTLTTISYLFLELGQEDRAFQVAKASGDEDMLLHLAATDIETGNYGRAFEAVEAITTAAGKARGLTQVAVGYIQSGDEDRGWELITQSLQLARTAKSPYEEYSDEEYKKQALSSITETLIAAKAYKQVLRLAEEIKDTSIQSNLLAELVLNLEEEANWPLLMKVLPQWLQAVQSMPDLEYRGRDLAKIANLYAKLNQYDQALQIVTAIADPASQASAFANLAAVYAECGQQEQVDRETQETLQKILQELKG